MGRLGNPQTRERNEARGDGPQREEVWPRRWGVHTLGPPVPGVCLVGTGYSGACQGRSLAASSRRQCWTQRGSLWAAVPFLAGDTRAQLMPHHAWSLKPGQAGRCERREPRAIPTWAVLAQEQPLGPRPELPWASLGPLCSLPPCSWASLPGPTAARGGPGRGPAGAEGRAGGSCPAIMDAGFPWPGRLRGARSCLAGP